jgi:hypothetical protein
MPSIRMSLRFRTPSPMRSSEQFAPFAPKKRNPPRTPKQPHTLVEPPAPQKIRQNRFASPEPRGLGFDQVIPHAPKKIRQNLFASPEPRQVEPVMPSAPRKKRHAKAPGAKRRS